MNVKFPSSLPNDCRSAMKPGTNPPVENNAISFAAMDPATIPAAEKPSAAITAGVRTTAATPPANQTKVKLISCLKHILRDLKFHWSSTSSHENSFTCGAIKEKTLKMFVFPGCNNSVYQM